MRDIVNSAYNSSTLPAKSNLVRMNSAGARGDYRSYRGFLESYGDNKNSIDDQESVSSTDSGISAASKYSETESINPSSRNLNDSKILQTTGSFSNYMENYNNKRFGSVKPATKQNLVKCEIVLQINDPLESSKNEHTQESSEDIIDAARLSKENYKDIKQALVNCFKTQKSNNKENNSKNTSTLTKEEICNTPALPSTCMMTISNCDTTKSDSIPPPPPPPILPLNTEQSTCIKPKKWNTVITDYEDSKSTDQGLHEKHPPPNEAASNLAKILKQHLSLPRRKELEQTEQQQCDEKKCKTVLAASPKTERTENSQPPPFPAQPKLFQPSSPVFRRQSSKENHIQNKIICSPTLSRRVQNGNHTLPRPSQSFARQQQTFPNDSINSSTMEYNTTTVVPVAEPTTKVTKDNPNVRKLVYNTYRGLLGAYNNKANDIIATLPRNMVREDKGVSKQLESMAHATAPPAPPGAVGHIPATRLKSEISDRRVEPPLCVQNAMLTKDKKPFTYTPGGIDLSEIRSPRMAKRLERNAMNEGVGPLPQNQPHHSNTQLPPSAMAAMQPQLSVQVFPTGGVPQLHQHNSAPPPPPPMNNIPPPPKAPPMRSASPVPLDALERPDMTKIIPENPMALLRKTSGPIVKQDPILNKQSSKNNNNQPQIGAFTPRSPESPQPIQSPQREVCARVGSIYVPPVHQTPPANQVVSSPTAIPPPPAYYKRQPSTPQSEPQSPQFSLQKPPTPSPVQSYNEPQSPESPKATLSKAPTPWLQKRQQQQQDVPPWAVNEQKQYNSSISQEPPQQQQQTQSVPWRTTNQQTELQQIQQPPSQPIHHQQEPQMWQTRQQTHPEPQLWQQRQQQPQSPPWHQHQQSPPIQAPKGGGGVQKQAQMRDNYKEFVPTERTEVVIVNEPPQVFQHPGASVRTNVRLNQAAQNNYQHQQHPGARIIPIQIEGTANGHSQSQAHKFTNNEGSPGAHNSGALNRQLSWNSNPTQSNTFKVLQKITNTDGDDDEDQVISEHSPKTPHHFPERQLSKQNENEQGGMRNFKQVPHSQPNVYQSGPNVRTIPIQIERDGPPKKYIPPSEQTVAEPKKYMGSSIPSRSFKILQAMTAPNDCAYPTEACENIENYANDPSSCTQSGFDSNCPFPYPYYIDPHWNAYLQNYPPPNNNNNSPRMTPIPPPWAYYYNTYLQYSPAIENSDESSETVKKQSGSLRATPVPHNGINSNDFAKTLNGNPRCTPVPFWPYYYPNYTNDAAKLDNNKENHEHNTNENAEDFDAQRNHLQYPPYWDPYYFAYYYGAPPPMYPPAYSPYPFYHTKQSDSEEVSGYSSNDEMSYYAARFAAMPQFSNHAPSSNVSKTPSRLQKNINCDLDKKTKQNDNIMQEASKALEKTKTRIEPYDDESSVAETSDSESEMFSYEVCRPSIAGLKAIRSVSDIKVYDAEESSQCSDTSENTNDEFDEFDEASSVCAMDETIPHQLSVIFEESERTDSAVRCLRESSVATTVSEGTVTIENSENEDEIEESNATALKKLPATVKNNVIEERRKTVPVIQVIETNDFKSLDVQTQLTMIRKTAEDENSDCIQNGKNELNSIITITEEDSDVDWWGELNKDKEFSRSKPDSTKITISKTLTEKEITNVTDNLQTNSIDSDNEPLDVWSRESRYEQSFLEDKTNNFEKIKNSSEESIDFWAQLKSDSDNSIKKKVDSTQLKSIKSSDSFNVKEGIETAEAALTNIISTINRRTLSCSNTKEDIVEDVDFWAEIKDSSEKHQCPITGDNVSIKQKEDITDTNLACSRNSSLSIVEVSNNQEKSNIDDGRIRTKNESHLNSNTKTEENTDDCKTEPQSTEEVLIAETKPLTVQERIKALQKSATYKTNSQQEESELKVSVKDRISVFEDTPALLSVDSNPQKRKSISRKSSLKSFEEFSEGEEGDSGVTSDISRHISETDTEPDSLELKKMNRYQRASTHSRLFKLLQDECDGEEEVFDKDTNITQNRPQFLNLPSEKIGDHESFSSSGFTSPSSPTVNERLVNELIQGLLKKKQGKVFKQMTMEKLQATALRILQEDMDGLETLSSSEDGGSLVSPKKPSTGNSTPAQTPQDFYGNFNEYSQYYDSWAEAARMYDAQCDILPSKAFKLIQDHAATNKTGAIAGLLARCPRVLSNKNVQKELLRLMDNNQSLSPSPEPFQQAPHANKAANAS